MEPNEDEATEPETCIKAVFFDLDDTLVLTHAADRAAHMAVTELLNQRHPFLDQQVIIDTFVKGFITQPWDPNNQIDVTEWRAQIWCRALEAQGVNDIQLAREMQRCFDTTRMTSFQLTPGVEAVQRAKLLACRADELFNTILVGGEEVHEKPHKSIFLKACELVGCTPEQSVMVGDNLKTDIQGGKNAGFLATVWVNVHGLNDPPIGAAKPTYTIRNICELPEVLPLY